MKRKNFIIAAVVLIVLLAVLTLASRKHVSVAEQNIESVESVETGSNTGSEKNSNGDVQESMNEESEDSFEPITMEDGGDIVIIVPEDQGHAGQ